MTKKEFKKYVGIIETPCFFKVNVGNLLSYTYTKSYTKNEIIDDLFFEIKNNRGTETMLKDFGVYMN